ncbi:ABC-three component system protein [Halobacillus sp. HZG1]|uniref:ABC-three component system protein n=1 Tax=Halobacillus sp. HZG1 TaxID=3111769 RepID=UPI002DBA7B64|nr:ABC-three component system protein [Halobacillus sp. HZG1]MEC3885166.1 ABC-three component system protein [Halobacillus sp. HZG1]
MDDKTPQVIDRKDTHNATSSWSGYTYQGRIAIYTTLCLINDLKIYNSEADIDLYELEIESFEDFSILKRNFYESIHQVKSYKDNSYINSYKSAILDLLGKVGKYKDVSKSYLHTACEVEKTTKSALRTLLEGYTPQSKIEVQNEYKQVLFDEGCYDQAFEGFTYSTVNSDDRFKTVIDLDETKNEIKNQIARFYELFESEMDKSKSIYIENIEYIYLNFISEIDDVIAYHHKYCTKSNPPKIQFKEFYDILLKRNIFDLSPNTLAQMLKEKMYKYYIEFKDESEGDITASQYDFWEQNWDYLRELDSGKVLTLFKKISPNKMMNSHGNLDVDDYLTLSNEHGFKFNLFWMVVWAKCLPESYENLFVLKKEGFNYLITTITNRQSSSIIDKLGRSISENIKKHNDLLPLMYDMNSLITTDITGEYNGNILELASAYKKEYPSLYEEYGRNITEPKRIEFIEVKKALEEFE